MWGVCGRHGSSCVIAVLTCHWTVRKMAHMVPLRSAVSIRMPKLTKEHRAARLAWATQHLNDEEETIKRRVFVDEKQFRVGDRSHRVWLEPIEPTPIRETRNYPPPAAHRHYSVDTSTALLINTPHPIPQALFLLSLHSRAFHNSSAQNPKLLFHPRKIFSGSECFCGNHSAWYRIDHGDG